MIEKKFFGRITLEINYIFIIIELSPSRLSQIEENWYSNKFWKFMEKKILQMHKRLQFIYKIDCKDKIVLSIARFVYNNCIHLQRESKVNASNIQTLMNVRIFPLCSFFLTNMRVNKDQKIFNCTTIFKYKVY